MNRRAIPLIGMISYGEESLRAEGFVAMPLGDSFKIDPKRLRPHYHDFFQVTLLLGKGRLMHDFRETEMAGAALFFLSPGQVHTIVPDDMHGTIVSFTREFLEPGGDHAASFLLDLPFFFASGALPWLTLTAAQAEEVAELFRELQQEFDEAKAGAGEVFRSLLRILFVRAARWQAVESPAAEGSRAAVLVRRFQQEIERHHHDWKTLEPFARQLGVTVNYLNDVVREETGQAAGEHVRLRRLLDAKRLLLHSTLSVSEIGYQLGFADPSYFSRFFRRYENVTPAEFRSQIREKYQKAGD
jgi:AraC-like DNA-binding protein